VSIASPTSPLSIATSIGRNQQQPTATNMSSIDSSSDDEWEEGGCWCHSLLDWQQQTATNMSSIQKQATFNFNLPGELMEVVVAFAATTGGPGKIEVDLATCRVLTMVNINYNSKFWWSNGIDRVISPTYMDQFLNLSKYVFFEIVEDKQISTATISAFKQLHDIVHYTVDDYHRDLYLFDRQSPETSCGKLHKSLVKTFKTLVMTIDPREREVFKNFIVSIFVKMDIWLKKFNMKLLEESLVLP
jgi:hypothetical protein